MYKRIMVPLDGSPTAEMTLPYATELAAHFDSEIILFSVIENGTTVTEGFFRSYLGTISANIRSDLQIHGKKDPVVRFKIVTGNPASEIMWNVDNDNIDLIVMASRGSSVESAWALGNIAAKIVRIAAKPVILIRQQVKDGELHPERLVRKILVPLDGSRVGEAALPHAEALARKLGAELVLFHAAEPAPWPMIKARDENGVKIASAYLDDIVEKIQKQGLLVTSHLVTGYPAEEIINYVETNAIDLIAISTHGRSGVGRWAIGSVTDKLLYAGNTPILVEHSKS
jgi:nucleotide-binding universal stress UspA family protein